MKKIKIRSIEYLVPESWLEVTLKQQIKVIDDSKEILDESLKKIALISGYGSIPIDVIKKSTISEINELAKSLSFISTPIPTVSITEFVFKGEKYNVMPTLMKAEFQDFVNAETALTNFKEQQHKALPYILAIMAKKENESLDDFDLEERAKLFEELPLPIVESLRVFFYQIEIASLIYLQSSSLKGMETQINAKAILLENSLKELDGGRWSTRLLRGILVKWIKYLNRKSKKFFNSIRSKS